MPTAPNMTALATESPSTLPSAQPVNPVEKTAKGGALEADPSADADIAASDEPEIVAPKAETAVSRWPIDLKQLEELCRFAEEADFTNSSALNAGMLTAAPTFQWLCGDRANFSLPKRDSHNIAVQNSSRYNPVVSSRATGDTASGDKDQLPYSIHLLLPRLLLAAASAGRLGVVKTCVAQGVSLHHRDENGRTVLHFAAFGGQAIVVQWILETAKQVPRNDEALLHNNICGPIAGYQLPVLIDDRRNDDNNKLPSDKKCDGCPDSYPTHRESQLVPEGIDERDLKGWTPLHIAVCRDHWESARVLLKFGASQLLPLSHLSPPCRYSGTHSFPIHFAAVRSNLDMMRLLISCGGQVTQRDEALRVPLHYAVARGRVDFVKAVVGMAPAMVSAVDRDRRSPLHVAASRGAISLLKVLLPHAPVSVLTSLDSMDMAPSEIARVAGHERLASVLEEHLAKCGVNTQSIGVSLTQPELSVVTTIHQQLEACWRGSRSLRAPTFQGSGRALGAGATNGNRYRNRFRSADIIPRCVRRLGLDRCLELLDLTLDVYRGEAMLRDRGEGNCRKSPIEVFMGLIQNAVHDGVFAKEDWLYINAESRERSRNDRLARRRRAANRWMNRSHVEEVEGSSMSNCVE